MTKEILLNKLGESPIIAAVRDGILDEALTSPASVIFHLDANILTIEKDILAARSAGKSLLIHLDLAEGIGDDRAGLAYLKQLGADGIISTKSNLIRGAKELDMVAVRRFFALDSKGVSAIAEMINACEPDLIEIMPGTLGKIIRRFSRGRVPVIAGGLIETKSELTEALSAGAIAVSTGRTELWQL